MSKTTNILLVGVGGQGTVLASKILSQVALEQGFDVKMSEIHGMSQRGGSVVTQVRMGQVVHSPLVEEGTADVILAFEKLEAYRYAHFLKPGGALIVSDQVIEPLPVIIGVAQYPPQIVEELKARNIKLVVAPALDIAVDCGNPKASNVVLMGIMAKNMDIPEEVWQKAIAAKVKAQFLELNKKAFDAGYNYQG